MKKVMFLLDEGSKIDDQFKEEILDYCQKNDLEFAGGIRFPFIIPIHNPKEFAEVLSEHDVDTFLVNEDLMMVSDAYNNGLLVKSLKENNITIQNIKTGLDLETTMAAMPDKIKAIYKDAVQFSLDKLGNEYTNVAIITNGSSEELIDKCRNYYESQDNVSITVVSLNNYIKEMEEGMDRIISDNLINSVVILNEELMNDELEQSLSALQDKHRFVIENTDELINSFDENITMSHQMLN